MYIRDEIIDFCNNFLSVDSFSDYCINGLQYTGKEEIRRISLGVTSSEKFLEQSAKWKADIAITHHGIIFGKINTIDRFLSRKISILDKNNTNLVGYHLPLDAHSKVGNNISLCNILGLENCARVDIGFIGYFSKPMSYDDFYKLVQEKINPNIPFAENFGTKKISSVCIISGGSSSYWKKAYESNADMFICGEIKESDFHAMAQAKINFIAAGHYATEKYGVQLLGAEIKKKFPELEIRFFEEYCPV